MHNFSQTYLEANNHVAPSCDTKQYCHRNPPKSMKVLTLGAKSLHPKNCLASLRTLDSRGPNLVNVTHFGKMQTKFESLLVLIYVLQAQRGEKLAQGNSVLL